MSQILVPARSALVRINQNSVRFSLFGRPGFRLIGNTVVVMSLFHYGSECRPKKLYLILNLIQKALEISTMNL